MSCAGCAAGIGPYEPEGSSGTPGGGCPCPPGLSDCAKPVAPSDSIVRSNPPQAARRFTAVVFISLIQGQKARPQSASPRVNRPLCVKRGQPGTIQISPDQSR